MDERGFNETSKSIAGDIYKIWNRVCINHHDYCDEYHQTELPIIE